MRALVSLAEALDAAMDSFRVRRSPGVLDAQAELLPRNAPIRRTNRFQRLDETEDSRSMQALSS
jgi:hypothetical protein